MAIELPTQKIEPKSQNPSRLILFSPPKHGKTTAVAALDNCLLIDLESGSDFVSALKVKVNSLEELQELGTEIMKAERPYKYIAIDTVTKLEEMLEWDATEEYMKQPVGKAFNRDPKDLSKFLPRNQWKSVLTLAEGSGYQHTRKWFLDQIEIFRQISPYRIYAAHVADKYIKDNGKEEVVGSEISLTGKLKTIFSSRVTSMCKIIADGDERYLNFDVLNDSIVAGSRAPHLKGRILISRKEKDGKIVTFWENIFNK